MELGIIEAKINRLQSVQEKIMEEEPTKANQITLNLIKQELKLIKSLVGEEYITQIMNGGDNNGQKSLIRRHSKK